MAHWKELPDSLDDAVRQLVVQLRRLKDRSGLSLASLAAKTEYSRSSWERWLNGKALPPRHGVEKLARIAGVEPTRLVVLHEVAEKTWQQRTRPERQESAGESGEECGRAESDTTVPAGPRTGVPVPVVAVAVVAAALLGLSVGMLTAAPWDGDDAGGKMSTAVDTPGTRPSALATPASHGPGRYAFKPGKSYPCKVHRAAGTGGGLVAGYSTTRTAVLAGPGWDVVEAQCLLRHHRLDPGVVDGVYGQQTIAAVMRLQKQAGLPADGVVGPHTWGVLRG